MFKNLQFFNELNEKEIMAALKAVLMKEKALVWLNGTYSPLRYLIPVETDVCFEIDISGRPISYDAKWESRMSKSLKPLKVSSDGYTHQNKLTAFFMSDWLYECKGVLAKLKPYKDKKGVFWVCGGTSVALDIISDKSGAELSERKTWEIDTVIDEKGIKLEVLRAEIFFNKESEKKAIDLMSCSISFGELAVADIPTTPQHEKSRSIQEKGGAVRQAKYAKLEGYAVGLWEAGNFKSKRQASTILLPKVNDFARKNGITPLTESSGADTIYRYLLKN